MAKHYDVIIIGAGASGLMCAISAAQRGRRVLIIEKSKKPGRKILMSGGGRCNFTNLNMGAEFFVSQNPHFCKSALSRFTQWDFISLVEESAIPYHQRQHGQLFCDQSSKDILAMLLQHCDQADVTILPLCEVTKIVHESSYCVHSNQGQFTSNSLVIASGGLSIPRMGSSDFGYRVATQFGLQITAKVASLVPFTFTEPLLQLFAKLSGNAIPVSVSTDSHSFTENLLFTHRGLSGPVILQASNYWTPGSSISINLLPDLDCCSQLFSYKKSHPKSLLKSLLNQHLPKNLVVELEQLWWPEHREKKLADFSNQSLERIAENLNAWRITPSGTEGYRTAEVTMGGVDTDELSSKTMASHKHAGLYFIGEVVDVTGHLGGYNFQWAWSSGYAAGQAV